MKKTEWEGEREREKGRELNWKIIRYINCLIHCNPVIVFAAIKTISSSIFRLWSFDENDYGLAHARQNTQIHRLAAAIFLFNGYAWWVLGGDSGSHDIIARIFLYTHNTLHNHPTSQPASQSTISSKQSNNNNRQFKYSWLICRFTGFSTAVVIFHVRDHI